MLCTKSQTNQMYQCDIPRSRTELCIINELPTDLLRKVMSLLPGPFLFVFEQSARSVHESQDDLGFWKDRLQSEFGALDFYIACNDRNVTVIRRIYVQMFMWHEAMKTFYLLQGLGVPSDIDDDTLIDGARLDLIVLRALAYTVALTAPNTTGLSVPQLRRLRAAGMLPLAVLVRSHCRNLRDRAAAALNNIVAPLMRSGASAASSRISVHCF